MQPRPPLDEGAYSSGELRCGLDCEDAPSFSTLIGVTAVVLHMFAPDALVPRRPMPPTKGPDVAASTSAAAACIIFEQLR